MKLTIERTAAASLAFAAGVFLLMAVGSVHSIQQMIDAAKWVTHTEQVRGEINSIMEMMAGWETAIRSYVANPRQETLDPFTNFRIQLDERVTNLGGLVQDNPLQVKNWEDFKSLIDARMKLIDDVVASRRDGTMTIESVTAAYRQGLASMEAIQARIKVMQAEEDRLLALRREASDRQAKQSITAAIMTAVLGLLVLLLAASLLFRQLRARQKAEALLAIRQAELQGIVDNAPVGIFLKNLEGRYILLNAPMKNLLGAEPAACLQKTPAEIFPAARAQNIAREDDEVLAARHPREIEMEIPCADGVARTYRTVKFPLYDPDGKIYALGGFSSDVTERKEMEDTTREALARAENASRTKSRFLANMSHELRTPLNSVIGFSEILSDEHFGALNDKQKQYLKNILSSGRHLLLLINDLLDLAKIEAGRMTLEPAQVTIAPLLQDTLTFAHSIADRKGVKLELKPVDSTLVARIDPGKVKQMIYNLLSNAVKFTPQGGRVLLSGERIVSPPCPRGTHAGEPLPGEWLRLSVTDTGIGIAKENLERIFVEFEQVDDSYSRQEQGTGLGLTLTRGLSELHGGYVWAESSGRTDQGSTFHILLPVAGPPAKSVKTAEKRPAPSSAIEGNGHLASSKPPPAANGKPLVLVVEDDLHARDLMASHLASGGYAVTFAGTGAEALRDAEALQPSAITLDVALPDSNGMDVLARLKATQNTRHIPVIMVTVTDDRQLGLSLGAAEFFIKPVGADKLLAALTRVRAAAQKEVEKVLVVDDEPSARESIKAILEPKGYKVHVSASGDEALRIIAHQMPDVAIIDLTMPGMSGFELVQKLRADPATRQLPICIYTAKDLSAAEMRWLHEHSTAITPKPFREQLLTELQRFCTHNSP